MLTARMLTSPLYPGTTSSCHFQWVQHARSEPLCLLIRKPASSVRVYRCIAHFLADGLDLHIYSLVHTLVHVCTFFRCFELINLLFYALLCPCLIVQGTGFQAFSWVALASCLYVATGTTSSTRRCMQVSLPASLIYEVDNKQVTCRGWQFRFSPSLTSEPVDMGSGDSRCAVSVQTRATRMVKNSIAFSARIKYALLEAPSAQCSSFLLY